MRIGYGISVAGSNQRSFATAQAAQVIWKVAVFGAGTTSSNGEYVWDGIEVDPFYGKPVYYNQNGSYIQYDEAFGWLIYDVIFEDGTYASSNLLDWYTGSPPWGASPVPSSALSYAQDSFIISVTVSGAGEPTSDGTYTRTNGGQSPFSRSSDSIDFDAGTWKIGDLTFGDYTYASIDLMSWSQLAGQLPTPDTSAIVYSA